MEYLVVWASSKIFFFKASFFRHYQFLLEPQGSFNILAETSDIRVTFLHSSLNMTHAFVILLSSYDLIPQGWREADVEQ
jgi:hypothetical protein